MTIDPRTLPDAFLYDLSGGMESASMIYLMREKIKESGAIVRWVDTGKQFPEMESSIAQIENICGLSVLRLTPKITFDEFLFERGGMLRQGYTDCSRRMKRAALNAHAKTLNAHVHIALGYNADEIVRGEKFKARNDRPWRTFFFPLQDLGVDRKKSVEICESAGFSILVGMYRKMGRFDCFFCPNQRPSQAEKVAHYYPILWAEWKEIERRKGHSILSISAEAMESQPDMIFALENKTECSCMGGSTDYDD